MATIEELKERRAALEDALYSGVLTVKHGDTLTTFRSVAEIERALAMLNSKISGRRRPAVGRQDDRGY